MTIETQQRETIEKIKALLENVADQIKEARAILRGESNE
jgi:hypothetical protein